MSKLILCGHSLGSGAHVACTDIASKYPHLDMEVIAGPRPGNMRFGIKCRKMSENDRVVFDNDIVPNIPSMLLGTTMVIVTACT
jgi:predicted lipase